MVTKTDNTSYLTSSVYLTRNLWSGILFGLGLVAFIDETIFHQLLHFIAVISKLLSQLTFCVWLQHDHFLKIILVFSS